MSAVKGFTSSFTIRADRMRFCLPGTRSIRVRALGNSRVCILNTKDPHRFTFGTTSVMIHHRYFFSPTKPGSMMRNFERTILGAIAIALSTTAARAQEPNFGRAVALTNSELFVGQPVNWYGQGAVYVYRADAAGQWR